MEVLRWGYRVPFLSEPPLAAEPIPFPSYGPSSIRGIALGKEVQSLQEKRAVELAPLPFPGFLQSDICGNEGLRVVETSDRFVHAQSESPQDSLQDGNSPVCASVCAKRRLDGVHRLEGCLLADPHTSGRLQVSQICSFDSGFSVQSSVFRPLYGPQVFTRVMAPVSVLLHHLGIRMCRYLDDWLILASSRSLFLQALETVLHLCQELGILVNWEKSQLTPSQRVVYLGVILDSTFFRASPSQPRVEKLCLTVKEFLSCDRQSASLWRRLLGILSSLTSIVPEGRLRMQSLQLRLHLLWDQMDDSTLIPWDQECRLDLEWWVTLDRLQSGISLAQVNPHLDFWSDALDVGWGVHLQDVTASGLWSPEEALLPINARELLAMQFGLH